MYLSYSFVNRWSFNILLNYIRLGYNFENTVSAVDYVGWGPCLALSAKQNIFVSLLTYLKRHASFTLFVFCDYVVMK